MNQGTLRQDLNAWRGAVFIEIIPSRAGPECAWLAFESVYGFWWEIRGGERRGEEEANEAMSGEDLKMDCGMIREEFPLKPAWPHLSWSTHSGV